MLRRTSLLAMVLCTVGLVTTAEAGEPDSAGTSGNVKTLAGRPYSRFCNGGDVVGTWQLVKFETQYQFKDPNAPYIILCHINSFISRTTG